LRRIILSHNSDDKSRLTRPMLAKPEDYAKATQRIWHTAGEASAIELPVISAGK
jgi:predicted acyl esterase